MKISRTKIDFFDGLITMEYNGDIAGHRVSDDESIFIPNASSLEVHKELVQMTHEHEEARIRNDDISKSHIEPNIAFELGDCPTDRKSVV